MSSCRLTRHRLTIEQLRHYSIQKAVEIHARSLGGESRRDALLLALHHASGRDRARLLAEAASIAS